MNNEMYDSFVNTYKSTSFCKALQYAIQACFSMNMECQILIVYSTKTELGQKSHLINLINDKFCVEQKPNNYNEIIKQICYKEFTKGGYKYTHRKIVIFSEISRNIMNKYGSLGFSRGITRISDSCRDLIIFNCGGKDE